MMCYHTLYILYTSYIIKSRVYHWNVIIYSNHNQNHNISTVCVCVCNDCQDCYIRMHWSYPKHVELRPAVIGHWAVGGCDISCINRHGVRWLRAGNKVRGVGWEDWVKGGRRGRGRWRRIIATHVEWEFLRSGRLYNSSLQI